MPSRRLSLVPERGEAIPELQRRIADLRARLPKHSVPVAMTVEIEELEEALQGMLHQRPPGAEAAAAPVEKSRGAPRHPSARRRRRVDADDGQRDPAQPQQYP